MKKHKWIVEVEYRGEKYRFLTKAFTGTDACIAARNALPDCKILGWVIDEK